MKNKYLVSDRVASVVSALVEAGFDADTIKGMKSDGNVVSADVECTPEACEKEGGYDERMDAAVETIAACLHELGFENVSVERDANGHSFSVGFRKGDDGMNNIGKLRDYLASTETQDALDLVVKVAPPKPDAFMDIMVALGAIGMLAKDVHYRAKGGSFYANHELMDLVHETEWKFDDLSEVYYMGEKQSLPPMRAKVCAKAAEKVMAVYGDTSELALTAALHTALLGLAGKVEIAKTSENPSSGVAAILDEISKDALKYAGLLKRRLEQGSSEE